MQPSFWGDDLWYASRFCQLGLGFGRHLVHDRHCASGTEEERCILHLVAQVESLNKKSLEVGTSNAVSRSGDAPNYRNELVT